MKIPKKPMEEQAALEVLRLTGVNILEAALLARDALERNHGRLNRAKQCIQAGDDALRRERKTVNFATAVSAALEARTSRRARTRVDLRYLTRRLMKRCSGLARRRLRSITTSDCAEYLHRAFPTPRQRNKARLALSSVFSTAQLRGWCHENPIRKLEAERIEEKRICILSPQQICTLLHTARTHNDGACLPAVAIMLFAGIRPNEVERLTWEHVRLKEGVICILPQHSKTGGARHVTIYPPLAKLLHSVPSHPPHTPICPRNWRRQWAELHRLAGWHPITNPWQEDILRHTFASYHLAAFHSYGELQFEMGHRSSELLRTRYIAMPQGKWSLLTHDTLPSP